MDAERVHAYLQVACAGLGFDIGEVWWASNQNGSSLTAIGKSLGHWLRPSRATKKNSARRAGDDKKAATM